MLNIESVPGLPEVQPDDDLALLITETMRQGQMTLRDGDVLVVAQKIVSKAEGRIVELATVEPRPEAVRLAAKCDKDPRLIELVLRESTSVLRTVPGVIIVEHRLGPVLANAGIDQSNLRPGDDHGHALLLPEDPDASAAALREALTAHFGVERLGVIVNDSIGRAWRLGTVGLAIGVAGMTALWDLRGDRDLFGRELLVSETGIADQVASAAQIVQGEGDEGTPVVRVRGLGRLGPAQTARDLLRPRDQDLFR
ncbi:MAG: coenzyme F420-0:L-glutamate ligase [Holophagales bacterium]|nr:coenzyme F420-0:L-glutamate ligase [Holophagales bacterium]MYD20671.1 coenzyme F420-0:L-glutamate ligase [Holophagales bacterium]MYI33951.1 coenzyme F420-0:L-glutamate ligase [Holophagales bacterium]